MKELLESAFRSGLSSASDLAPLLQRCLQALREHLELEVAFVSEFKDGRRYFQAVACAPDAALIRVGDSDPLEQSYCQRVVDGRLPGLIRDATQLAEARTLPVTTSLPVGAHLSVPIRLRDGQVYGTLCGFSRRPDPSLGPRDLRMLQVCAELLAEPLGEHLERRQQQLQAGERIAALLDGGGGLNMVYQPICHLSQCGIAGFEALSRFAPQPARGPEQWFAEAAAVGRGAELELQAISAALGPLSRFPARAYLAVNAAPATLLDPRLPELLAEQPLERVVLELTEHAAVEHYAALAQALRPLQQRGLRLAIDDAGAGYASFRHVLNLNPQLIKLDLSLTRDLHRDRGRYALAAALCGFARATDCRIVAEGVECAAELEALRELGVASAQGYYLGRPMGLDRALALAGGATLH